MTPTPEQIAKLPKWAQDELKKVSREREDAVRHLNDFKDASTPSSFWVEEMVCTGESQGPSTKRSYVQAHTIHVSHAGIQLDVSCFRDGEITLQWSDKMRSGVEIALVPESFLRAKLVHPDNLRK